MQELFCRFSPKLRTIPAQFISSQINLNPSVVVRVGLIKTKDRLELGSVEEMSSLIPSCKLFDNDP